MEKCSQTRVCGHALRRELASWLCTSCGVRLDRGESWTFRLYGSHRNGVWRRGQVLSGGREVPCPHGSDSSRRFSQREHTRPAWSGHASPVRQKQASTARQEAPRSKSRTGKEKPQGGRCQNPRSTSGPWWKWPDCEGTSPFTARGHACTTEHPGHSCTTCH